MGQSITPQRSKYSLFILLLNVTMKREHLHHQIGFVNDRTGVIHNKNETKAMKIG